MFHLTPARTALRSSRAPPAFGGKFGIFVFGPFYLETGDAPVGIFSLCRDVRKLTGKKRGGLGGEVPSSGIGCQNRVPTLSLRLYFFTS